MQCRYVLTKKISYTCYNGKVTENKAQRKMVAFACHTNNLTDIYDVLRKHRALLPLENKKAYQVNG